jgi:hypothetical protein
MFTDMDSAGQLRWRLSDYPIALLALPTRLGVIQVRPSSQLIQKKLRMGGALGALQPLQSLGRCPLREARAGDHFPVG